MVDKCKVHKHYRGVNPPTNECVDCWNFFNFKNPHAVTLEEYKQIKLAKEQKKQRRKEQKNTSAKMKEYRDIVKIAKKYLQLDYIYDLDDKYHFNQMSKKYTVGIIGIAMFITNLLFFYNSEQVDVKNNIRNFLYALSAKYKQDIIDYWLGLIKANSTALHYQEAVNNSIDNANFVDIAINHLVEYIYTYACLKQRYSFDA